MGDGHEDAQGKQRQQELLVATAGAGQRRPGHLGDETPGRAWHRGETGNDVSSCQVLGADGVDLTVPQGAFTVEAWIRGDDFEGRRGLISKAEYSEFDNGQCTVEQTFIQYYIVEGQQGPAPGLTSPSSTISWWHTPQPTS